MSAYSATTGTHLWDSSPPFGGRYFGIAPVSGGANGVVYFAMDSGENSGPYNNGTVIAANDTTGEVLWTYLAPLSMPFSDFVFTVVGGYGTLLVGFYGNLESTVTLIALSD